MKNFRKYVSIFLISTILLLIFYPQSNAFDSCSQQSTVTKNSLIKIAENIYISKNGKIYEKIDCSTLGNIARNYYNNPLNYQQFYEYSNFYQDWSSYELATSNEYSQGSYQEESDYYQEWADYEQERADYNPSLGYDDWAEDYLDNLLLDEQERNSDESADQQPLPNPESPPPDPFFYIPPDPSLYLTPSSNSTPHNNLDNRGNKEPQIIEISPVSGSKIVELDRDLTIDEIIKLKNYLFEEINDKLSKKYDSNYSLIEISDSLLRAKVENLNSEITNSTWETLELTITPTIVSSRRIDVVVSAILYVQSGFRVSVPPKSGFKISNDYLKLEEYINKLIIYLRNEIPVSDFFLQKEVIF